MEVKILRRHSADCPDKADRCASRCGCPMWGEFNWPDLDHEPRLIAIAVALQRCSVPIVCCF
jgi:hypothetical protein